MADSTSFPQIPSTVWTGVWKILHDSPSRRIDEKIISVELGVQPTAARQYLKELNKLGLFNPDGTPTDLAKKWRQDGDDSAVIGEILENAYPQDLRELAPPDRLDRDKIVRWFVSQNLGGGSAQNKAATYIRIAGGVNSSAVNGSNGPTALAAERSVTRASTPASPSRNRSNRKEGPPIRPDRGSENGGSGDSSNDSRGSGGQPALHVNIQIHISADSSSEQIDTIFSAMRRYFNGASASE